MSNLYSISLDLGFNIFKDIEEDCQALEVTTFNFSGGEPHLKIENAEELFITKDDYLIISSRYKSFQSLATIALAVDAAKRLGFKNISLCLPYLPAARQDRVMVNGEPLSLKVVADFINSLDLDNVVIWDCHSDVSTALINNVRNIENYTFINNVLNDIKSRPINSDLMIVSPDAGSNKKIYGLIKYLGLDEDETVVKCNKHRNTSTGHIDYVKVYTDNVKGKDCLIVDDICDGGYTFLLTAKALKEKGANRLYLAVTHGIFSKGFDELNKYFDLIYTTDSFDGERSQNVVELKFM